MFFHNLQEAFIRTYFFNFASKLEKHGCVTRLTQKMSNYQNKTFLIKKIKFFKENSLFRILLAVAVLIHICVSFSHLSNKSSARMQNCSSCNILSLCPRKKVTTHLPVKRLTSYPRL